MLSLPNDIPKISLISLSVLSKEQKVTMAQGGNGTPRDEVLYLAAGVADLMAERVRGLTRRLPGLAEACQELRARGELALGRTGTEPAAHMEVLARQAAERNQDG